MKWDPSQYARYAGERERPFSEMLARVGAVAPRRAIDLGCGAGTTTVYLKERYPEAEVEGLDLSQEMIAAAAPLAGPGLSFRVGDVQDWVMPDDADVIVCNAVLQWVPGHVDLMSSWARQLGPGAWLGVQVPANFSAPTHSVMRELAESPRWQSQLGGVLRHHDSVATALFYARTMQEAGLTVDAWETSYVHVLTGEDPVVDWLLGTGLRPILEILDETDAAEFVVEFARRMRLEYPATEHGTLLPYRRIFTVAHRP
jgi:trans-aconitate 2-methyltransferase